MDPSGAVYATWAQFREDAPDLARRIRERFEANRHHVIGTIRADGTPRLSGTEVAFERDVMTVGMMADSRKLGDVVRDKRVEIHSAPLEEDLAHGDAKVSGMLVASDDDVAPREGVVFRLLIRRASLVQVADDELVITVWRPGEGTRLVTRQ
jgi:hypothetical protein